MEAQRYPADYDGIIAGAPANYWTHLTSAAAWVGQAVNKSESSYIPPAKYPLIHTAAVNACDDLDGVKDGVIEVPVLGQAQPDIFILEMATYPDARVPSQAVRDTALVYLNVISCRR